MTTKQIIFNEYARQALLRGVDKVANTLKVTLGPMGKTVILDKIGNPIVSNDGVTIAKEIELHDKFENIGAKLIKEVSSRTQDTAGDGTTTASVLAQVLVNESLKNVAAGANSVEIKKGIERATEAVVEFLQKKSAAVSGKEKIRQVATISANNDEEIGRIISDAMEKVGSHGVITVEEAKSIETSLEVVEGMQFDRGFVSPYMVSDPEKMICELDEPYILITDKKISTIKQLVPVLERAAGEGKPLFIIAEDVEGEAVTTLVLNLLRGALKVCAVKSPGYGEEQKEILQDIAVLTGGKVVSEEKGMKIEELEEDVLGSARRISVNSEKTIIIEGKGDKKEIEKRKKIIETQIEREDSEYKKEDLRKRLAKLGGGVAVVKVGAATETEMKEKKLRIDDALNATKAAVEEGVVVGGGIALYRAIPSVENLRLDGDQKIGMEIVKKALEEPVRQISENAGKEGAEIIAYLKKESDENMGYNAKTDKFENLVTAGVIDPTKVVRSALQNAASIAAMIVTTEALVADFDAEKDEKKEMIII